MVRRSSVVNLYTSWITLNPARGRKLDVIDGPRRVVSRWITLNPARERKLTADDVEARVYQHRLDNLEPREGTETISPAAVSRRTSAYACWITLNPERGQKIINVDAVSSVSKSSAFIQIANDMLVSCN